MARVSRDVATHISFAISTILCHDDGSCEIVRVQKRACVARASRKAPQQILRADVPVVDLAAYFGIVRVLSLACRLLNALIRHGVVRVASRNREPQAVTF